MKMFIFSNYYYLVMLEYFLNIVSPSLLTPCIQVYILICTYTLVLMTISMYIYKYIYIYIYTKCRHIYILGGWQSGGFKKEKPNAH